MLADGGVGRPSGGGCPLTFHPDDINALPPVGGPFRVSRSKATPPLSRMDFDSCQCVSAAKRVSDNHPDRINTKCRLLSSVTDVSVTPLGGDARN